MTATFYHKMPFIFFSSLKARCIHIVWLFDSTPFVSFILHWMSVLFVLHIEKTATVGELISHLVTISGITSTTVVSQGSFFKKLLIYLSWPQSAGSSDAGSSDMTKRSPEMLPLSNRWVLYNKTFWERAHSFNFFILF